MDAKHRAQFVLRTNGALGDGEVVWFQCRRFEVPAELPRVRDWNFKSKAALKY
jgi:hypothetical protein